MAQKEFNINLMWDKKNHIDATSMHGSQYPVVTLPVTLSYFLCSLEPLNTCSFKKK